MNIKIDSRKIVPGDTFVALKGTNVDGHDFIDKAISNGATKIVVEHDVDCSVEKIIVEDDDAKAWLETIIVEFGKDVVVSKS